MYTYVSLSIYIYIYIYTHTYTYIQPARAFAEAATSPSCGVLGSFPEDTRGDRVEHCLIHYYVIVYYVIV